MKTLDEVIKAMDHVEFCCTNCKLQFDCDEVECFLEDALHYLKEYRSDMQMYAENQKHWETELMQKIKDFGDAKERYIAKLKKLDIGTLNEPLSWEQLKQMEGKPVWFEVTDPKALPALDSGWGIVGCTSFSTWEGVESFSLVKVGVTYAVPIAQYGRAWNVYRKERL